jgi:hypothetical protein
MSPKKIEKEEIAQLHFSSAEVLHSTVQVSERDHALQNAVILGNIEKQKCKIVFHADEGDSYVETTVWAVTDKHVFLKGGLALLIASILEVII